MKALIIMLFFVVAQGPTSNTQPVTDVAADYTSIFRRQIDPYLRKFVQLQYSEAKTEEERLSLENEYLLYAQKADFINTDFIKSISSQKDVTKERMYKQLDKMYRYEFPGLDKAFFDNVKKEIEKIK